MTKLIPYGKQFVDKLDILEVTKALKQDLITTGSYVSKVENSFKNFFNSKFVLACNNGTSALFVALKAIGVKSGDVIIAPAINFVALNNVALLLNLKCYLADIEIKSGQISFATVQECIKIHKLKKIKAICPMYIGGNVANIKDIVKLKSFYKCFIIEDACHALGSSYVFRGKKYKVGQCAHSDISTFSLHPVKAITSGEGGIVSTNSKKLFEKMRIVRNHGMIVDKHSTNKKYNIVTNSLNFRLSDINCALAYSQLKKIKKFVKKRNSIASFYNDKTKHMQQYFTPLVKNNFSYNSWHLYQIILDKKFKDHRDKLMKFFLKKKIITQIHYLPIYKHSIFKNLKSKNLRNSELFYQRVISLPIFYQLNRKKQERIVTILIDFFRK